MTTIRINAKNKINITVLENPEKVSSLYNNTLNHIRLTRQKTGNFIHINKSQILFWGDSDDLEDTW